MTWRIVKRMSVKKKKKEKTEEAFEDKTRWKNVVVCSSDALNEMYS